MSDGPYIEDTHDIAGEIGNMVIDYAQRNDCTAPDLIRRIELILDKLVEQGTLVVNAQADRQTASIILLNGATT